MNSTKMICLHHHVVSLLKGLFCHPILCTKSDTNLQAFSQCFILMPDHFQICLSPMKKTPVSYPLF